MKHVKRNAKQCYFCGRPASSKEHVPPKSFFPETKDLPPRSPDYRRNLVTVDSCLTHNGRYSKDDEIAAYTVLMHLDTNAVGSTQFRTKAIRAIEQSDGLSRRLIRSIRPVRLPDGRETGAVQIDAQALDRVIEKIARGLYFHDHKQLWRKSLVLVGDGPVMADLRQSPYAPLIPPLRQAFAAIPSRGTHPEVFQYQWLRSSQFDDYLLRMHFYEGLAFFVFPTEVVGGQLPATPAPLSSLTDSDDDEPA